MAHFSAVPTGSTPGANRVTEELDVFKILPNGDVLWCGSFSSPVAAEARIHALLVSDPSEYFIHDQPTGQKVFFKPNGHNGHGNGNR